MNKNNNSKRRSEELRKAFIKGVREGKININSIDDLWDAVAPGRGEMTYEEWRVLEDLLGEDNPIACPSDSSGSKGHKEDDEQTR